MTRRKVVVTNHVFEQTLELLQANFEVVDNQTGNALSYHQLRTVAKDAWGILAFMPDLIDGPLVDDCPALRIVACALKGYDNFDVAACSARGVVLTIVPDLLTEPTAELAIGLAIALCRHVAPADRYVRAGLFTGWRPMFYGRSIDGSVVAIIGSGRVGQAIARKLAGFSCDIRMTDDDPRVTAASNAVLVSTEAALRVADIVFLAVPLLAKTQHMVDAAWLAQLKPGAILINPARGSVVDESAVADALESGLLGGYAADVFEFEDWARADRPTGIHPRLVAETDKTLLTPHIGSAVNKVRLAIELEAVHNLIEFAHGSRPRGALATTEPIP